MDELKSAMKEDEAVDEDNEQRPPKRDGRSKQKGNISFPVAQDNEQTTLQNNSMQFMNGNSKTSTLGGCNGIGQ